MAYPTEYGTTRQNDDRRHEETGAERHLRGARGQQTRSVPSRSATQRSGGKGYPGRALNRLARWSDVAKLQVRRQDGSTSVDHRDFSWCDDCSGFKEEHDTVVDGIFDQNVIAEPDPHRSGLLGSISHDVSTAREVLGTKSGTEVHPRTASMWMLSRPSAKYVYPPYTFRSLPGHESRNRCQSGNHIRGLRGN